MPDREAAAQLVCDHTTQTASDKPWLIVYDNVEAPDQLDKLTPANGAHVLITTRWPDWYGMPTRCRVGVFSRSVTIDFLLAKARGSDERPEATRAEAAAAQLTEQAQHIVPEQPVSA